MQRLFSFRSADGSRYPRIEQIQTMDLAFDEKSLARLIEKGRAHVDAEQNAVIFTELERPKAHIIGSASEWSDVIGSESFAENPIIVSERIIAALKRDGMSGWTAKAVDVVKRSTRKLNTSSAPQYFFLIISGRINIPVPSWIRASDVPADSANQLMSAWDGADFFLDRREIGRGSVFCSERVFNLARTEGWTNCGFQPLEFFAPFHKLYLKHETKRPLSDLVQQYIAKLK